jgi:hypothetical protein
MEGILFFLNTNVFFYIHFDIQFSSYDFKSVFKEFPSRIVWNNGNFQILITINMSFKQSNVIFIEIIVKNYLPWVTCNDSPFGNKIPIFIYKITFNPSLTTIPYQRHMWVPTNSSSTNNVKVFGASLSLSKLPL